MSYLTSPSAVAEVSRGRFVTHLPMQEVVVDLVDRSLRTTSLRIALTPGEFSLLMFFLRTRGRELARDEIIQQVNGGDAPVTARSVDVRIAGLRRKLRPLGQPIGTVRDVGYLFREDSDLSWSISDGFGTTLFPRNTPPDG
jgi:DNA-binding response OmpR family regulator